MSEQITPLAVGDTQVGTMDTMTWGYSHNDDETNERDKSKEPIVWQPPHERGQTIEQRFARLAKYIRCYTGRNAPKTQGRRNQLARYQSEARFLRDLQGDIS